LQDIFLYPMAKFLLSRHLGMDSDRRKESDYAMAEFQAEIKNILDEVEFDSEPLQIQEVW